VDTTNVGNIVLFGLAEFMKYYGFKNCFFLHLSYIGKNQFIHKIFSPEGVEMVYCRDSVSGNDIEHGVVNEHVVSGIPDNVGVSAIPDNASHISDDGLVKYLTHYDVRISCLVYFMFMAVYFSELYCYGIDDDGSAAGDDIKFVIDDDKKNIIHVVKV